LMVTRRYEWEGGGFIYTYSVYLVVNVLLALGRDMLGMLLISESGCWRWHWHWHWHLLSMGG
jgi:hypothetical protein